MAECVYLLCGLTSVMCAALLGRAYLRRRLRLLLWAALCFFGLAINNSLLFVDFVVIPQIDLAPFRSVFALTGISALVFGLIWDAL